MRNLLYFIREGFKGIKANFSTSIGSIVTIYLSLFLIGGFMFANAIANNVTNAVEDQVAITAYISDDASADKEIYSPVMTEIENIDGVQEVTFTSKKQALENFQNTMNNELMDQFDEEDNPLPASFTVILSSPQKVHEIAAEIQQMDSFVEICDNPSNPDSSVKYGQRTVEKLFSVTNVVKTVGVAFVIILIFVAFVFMNNTIKLAVANRSEEMSIQKLVGASKAFIRGPYLTEGIIHAIIGIVLAIGTLQCVVSFIMPTFANSLEWLPLGISDNTVLATYVTMAAAGLIIGIMSSYLAMRKYLRV